MCTQRAIEYAKTGIHKSIAECVTWAQKKMRKWICFVVVKSEIAVKEKEAKVGVQKIMVVRRKIVS